jgi:hypothetical protein
MRIVGLILKWVGILFVVLLVLSGGGIFLVEIPVILAFGWIGFLRDNLATMEVNPLLWAEAAGCIVALGLGGHWFARWLYGEMTPGAVQPWRPGWTVAGLAALLLLFIAGIATIGITHQTAWVFTAKEPFIRNTWEARINVSRALSEVGQLKEAVEEAHRRTGRLPGSEAEAGLSRGFEPTNYVLERSVGQGGVIRIEFAKSVAGGGVLTLTPAAEGNAIKWVCRSSLPQRELPGSCRD